MTDRNLYVEHSTEVLHNVHHPNQCEGRPCALHNRSNHHMRSFPQHWRDDVGYMERICPHGIGHPDPDERPDLDVIHGCDGCCTRPA